MNQSIRRRTFTAGALALAAAPGAARAQGLGAKVPRLAWVHQSFSTDDLGEHGPPQMRAFYDELRRLGWIEGRSISIERWSFNSQVDRYSELVRAVVRADPSVIAVEGNILVELFKAVSTTIPVVALMGDPLVRGLVTSLARPEANVTGFSLDGGFEISGKLVQYLVETLPGVSRFAYISGTLSATGAEPQSTAAIRDAAAKMNRALVVVPLEGEVNAEWYRRTLASLKAQGVEALIFANAAINVANAELIAELATSYGWPTISSYLFAAESGALLSYGADIVAQYTRMAGYVDRILKGAKPAELPVQQPERFRLVVNLKTAKRLGIDLPISIQISATDFIE